MSELTPSVVALLQEVNNVYATQQAEAGGFGAQIGWPPADATYPAIIKSMVIVPETSVFVSKTRDKIKCPAIKFVFETLPDREDPEFDEENPVVYNFTGEVMAIVPVSELTGVLAETGTGVGWFVNRDRGRLKGFLTTINGEDLPLPEAVAKAHELINGSDEVVAINLFIDLYEKKDPVTGAVTRTSLTDFARGACDV